MTNENNEFDEPEFDTDLGFDDTDNAAKKNNPLIKIGVVAAGVVVVLVAIFMMGGPKKKTTDSEVAAAPIDSQSTPGQKELTPVVRDAVVNYNQELVDQAKATGGSVMPIPVDPPRQKIQTDLSTSQEDPAERFRRVQDEYRRQQEEQMSQQNSQAAQEQAQARQQAVENMSQAMGSYLSTAASSRQPKDMQQVSVAFTPDADGGVLGLGNGTDSTAAPLVVGEAQMILPATTIEYGQLMIEANTDAPGPVMVMMATGKLAGSRLLGTFQKTKEYLTIQFNQLVRKDGTSISISAIMLDPKTTLPGMVTEIDHKYFERYIIPAAANFISGVGSAIAETKTSTTQSDSSTTTSSNDPDFDEAIAEGISDSFDGVADALEENASETEIMLRIAAGTPVGILFLQPVLDPDSVREVQAQQAAIAAQQAASNPTGPLLSQQVPYYAQIIQPLAVQPMSGAVAPATPVLNAGTAVTPTATIPAK